MPRPTSKVAATAYDGILFSILTAEYVPGQALPEERLAEKFGASRSAVREALARLEEDGLVESKPKVSAQVRLIPRPEEIMASQEARFYLESLAGCELIRRLAAGTAELTEIEELHGAMAEIADQTPPHSRLQKAEFLIKDFRFHLAIPRLAGCSHFEAPLNRLLHSVRIHSLPIYLKHEDLRLVVDEHVQILEALRKRDPVLFVEKTREHLDNATTRWLWGEQALRPVAGRLEDLCRACGLLKSAQEQSSAGKRPRRTAT